MLKKILEKVQKNGPAGRKKDDRQSNRTRHDNKRRAGKVESNDSPEILDWGKTSDIPGLPSGAITGRRRPFKLKNHNYVADRLAD